MVCRAPTLNGTPVSVRNQAQVEAMPGVTHVAQVSTGIAVRAATFGQCIDAVRALDVAWKAGPVAGESDATILRKVRAAQLPMPRLPDTPLAQTVSGDFTFWFRSNSAIDEVWSRSDFHMLKREHFYHVGSSEDLRHPMIEALISNFPMMSDEPPSNGGPS